MKKFFATLALTLIATSVGAFAQPKMEIVGGNTYDWGKVKSIESPLKTIFVLKNTGTDTLFVPKVKASCGCTYVPQYKKAIAPNDTAHINVSLRVSSRDMGSMTKTITVTSNDSTKKKSVLYLKCYVNQPLYLSPRYIQMSQVSVNTESKGVITLKNTTDKPITITKLKILPETLKLNIKQGTVLPPKKEFKLTTSYTTDTAKRMSGSIKIETDVKEQKNISISVWGTITPAKKN